MDKTIKDIKNLDKKIISECISIDDKYKLIRCYFCNNLAQYFLVVGEYDDYRYYRLCYDHQKYINSLSSFQLDEMKFISIETL